MKALKDDGNGYMMAELNNLLFHNEGDIGALAMDAVVVSAMVAELVVMEVAVIELVGVGVAKRIEKYTYLIRLIHACIRQNRLISDELHENVTDGRPLSPTEKRTGS